MPKTKNAPERIADPVIHIKIPIKVYRELMRIAKLDERTLNGYVRKLLTAAVK